MKALFWSKQNYNFTNYVQVGIARLMSKIEYLIVPKGTKFTGSSNLGLKSQVCILNNEVLIKDFLIKNNTEQSYVVNIVFIVQLRKLKN